MSEHDQGMIKAAELGDMPTRTNSRTHRNRTFKTGIISYQDHTLTVDCIVRDINSEGVKLKFEKNALVPDSFMLTIPMDGTKVDCEVKWRVGQEVGAAFVSDRQTATRNVRKQSVDVKYVVPRKATLLRRQS